MKKPLLVFLIATMLAVAAPTTDLDVQGELQRRSYGIPNRAIAMVEDGKTTLVRELSALATVDADTSIPAGNHRRDGP